MSSCPEHQGFLSQAVTLQTGQGEGLDHYSLSLKSDMAHHSTVPKERVPDLGSQVKAPGLAGLLSVCCPSGCQHREVQVTTGNDPSC